MIHIAIACDKCGRDSGRIAPRSEGVNPLRAMLSTLGWTVQWVGDRIQQAEDRCPACKERK